jgi:putative AlgH/UPF0301 family transcriptional regulator
MAPRDGPSSQPAQGPGIGGKRGPAKVLVAFGYAGWGPTQPENEIEEGGWETAEADPTLVFGEDRGNVWDIAWKRRTQHSDIEIPMRRRTVLAQSP